MMTPDQPRLQWVSGRDDLRFPKSGLLEELSEDGCKSAIGFRPADGGCELWFEGGENSANWNELLQRVTDQARKAKFQTAVVVSHGVIPDGPAIALTNAGFSGDPLSRPLYCDAPDDLQPYLDWKGRVTRLAEGKGSEAINCRLYAMLADHIPPESVYSEIEVNSVLKQWHLFGDHAGLRRELVDRGYLARTRDCREYWRPTGPVGETT